jgi:soluble lytic murein transglycosylase-like protein
LIIARTSGLFAGETVIFRDGRRMRADGHDADGNLLIVRNGLQSLLYNQDEILRIEPDTPPQNPRAAAPAAAPSKSRVDRLIDEAARKHGLHPEFVRAVAQTESGGNQNAVSYKGAIGIMQLMPATAKALGADPHNLEQNLDAGVRFLRQQLDAYAGDPDQVRKALAAYNAGPAAVRNFGGVPPYQETQRYVNKIVDTWTRTAPPSAR